jgi:DNA modification methylase
LTPIHEDDWLTVYGGDNREVLRTLPDESVQCVVTSPPYWGLRDYGTASWDGGDPECDHVERVMKPSRKSTLDDHGEDGRSPYLDSLAGIPFKGTCGKCGAIRQDRQLGLEQTPEEYVAAMVDVFREVRRVLRKDGTLWLNLGDSYASDIKGSGGDGTTSSLGTTGHAQSAAGTKRSGDRQRIAEPRRIQHGLKPKDLVGIPWRVAFALQADGWYLRSDIIWAKPNPMPESVTDRPTKSHEYLFLLSKSATYHYDADAVREDFADERMGNPGTYRNGYSEGAGRNDAATKGVAWLKGEERGGRNRRSVWTIATKPYPGAHFATFPEALVEPCILAGTSAAGACATCGAPWERVVERPENPYPGSSHTHERDAEQGGTQTHASGKPAGTIMAQRWHARGAGGTTTGFRRTCSHDGDPVPCVVLDPFAGTGTVGAVAQRLSRRALLIDLNPDYLRQCLTRNQQTPLGLGH